MRSGRLRHIVGASELLDSLTPTLLDDVLETLNLVDGHTVRFSRRAGGAVYLFSDDESTRDNFYELWSLVVRQYAPGLDFAIANGEGDDDYQAFKQARDALQAAHYRQVPITPAGTPLSLYTQRTGEPAIAVDPKLGLQDTTTHRFGMDRFWKRNGGLTSRFAENIPIEDWPRNLNYDPEIPIKDQSVFPFWKDNRYLALFHADGLFAKQLVSG